MNSLSILEHSVSQLHDEDFAKFRQWFWEYENGKWDARIEKDIAGNKLEAVANKALSDFNGKYKTL